MPHGGGRCCFFYVSGTSAYVRVFFFSSRRRHTRWNCDWSSDVSSSDLANAVNGVINIITKSAKDTQGLLVSGGGGSLLQDFGAVRYGGAVGSNFFYRLYGQRFDRNSTALPNGNDSTNA